MALDIDSKYLTDGGELNLAGFIQGKVGFSLTDINIATITVSRSAEYEEAAKDVEERTRDLCWADALILYITKDSKSETDGGSTQSETTSNYSKDEAQDMAMYLYEKWGEVFSDSSDSIDGSPTNLW